MPNQSTNESIATWMFGAVATILIVAFLLKAFSLLKKDGMVLIAILFVFCALMTSPDRFDTLKFSASGVETKARAAIHDVNISLKQLQDMQVAFARSNLSQLAMAGQFFSGLTTKSKFEIRDAIVESLHESGVDADKIRTAQNVWREAYCDLLLNHIVEVLKSGGKPDAESELAKLPQDPSLSVPTPDVLQTWIDKTSPQNENLTKLLSAYKSMYDTGNMSDPDQIPANEIVQQHIPTSPDGLKPGQVWNNGGVPSVVR